MRAVAAPASLKGVLTAQEAALLLASGLARAGIGVEELPVADGGEGTAAVLHATLGGTWRTAAVTDALGRPTSADWLLLDDGTAVVEAAAAIGLPQLGDRLDPWNATSRGLGELILATLSDAPRALLVCLGGSATVDGGVGMRAVAGAWLHELPVQVLCDVRNPLLGERGAARAFGPQKGADEEMVERLEERLASLVELVPYRNLPGAGAAGGLGAMFAALGAELVEGAEHVLDRIGFDARIRDADLVVTGEGTVDATTYEGKAPGAVLARCERLGVRCELFGGLVHDGIRAHALSGRRQLAGEDLVELGELLARQLLDPATGRL